MKYLRPVLAVLSGLLTLTVIAVAITYLYIVPQLPSIETLRDVRLQVPLRVYSADGELLAEFGEKRRIPVSYAQVPDKLVQAFLAAEDDRFFEHPGVDYQGLLRAALELARTGQKRQGGSTITMQVARNFFLSSEKTYLRKLTEIFLALKIERELSKEEILELYLNKIYLGHRAYGVGAAARVYYGTDLDGLTVPQMAMIAALPKAPSRTNPVTSPEAALARRDYVLGRMLEQGYLDDESYQAAVDEPDNASLHAASVDLRAPYIAEMVRAEMVSRFGPDAYTRGFQVITTVDSNMQRAAINALRKGLLDYDTRHGYRGPEGHTGPANLDDAESRVTLLNEQRVYGGIQPALVEGADPESITATLRDGQTITIDRKGIDWARPYINAARVGDPPKAASDVVTAGDVIRVRQDAEGNWQLSQLPEVEGAIVAMRPDDGAILALTGGFDFRLSKFNRATQAFRQPGSSFKPFVYSAALERGFTAASVLNDAPVVFDDPALERAWRPENYSGRFYGPTRIREALVNSRNLVSVRLLRAVGIRSAINHAQRFGFDREKMPRDLSLALGSGAVTPLEINSAYAVFANGGFRVEPFLIRRIMDVHGEIIFEANPAVACRDCEEMLAGMEPVETPEATPASEALPETETGTRPAHAEAVISPQNAWLMTSMLQDVIKRGTGRRAMKLGRSDLAGKTGTTNDQRDAWFCGFNPELVVTAWVGFDTVQPLGPAETGGRAALPMWMGFVQQALDGVPEKHLPAPPGLVTVRVDPVTGLLARSGQKNAVFETFREGYAPQEASRSVSNAGEQSPADSVEQLF